MTNQTTAVAKTEDKTLVEFVPFGASDKVKLSVQIVKNLVAVKTKQGKTCSDQDAIKFLAMCQARRLNPFEGDAFLIGYDNKDGGATFSLITAHQAFLKRAELNVEYDGMKSGIIVERDGQIQDLEGDFYLAGDRIMGGWATVYFKNRKQPMHKRIRMERFKKPFGIWLDDAAGMICKCAEADALRSSFPTMLGGLFLKEEIERGSDVKVSTPMFSSPALSAKAIDVPVEPDPTPPPTVPDSVPTDPKASPDEIKGALKAVRSLARKENITETQLLDWLINIGAVSADAASLDQAVLENEACLQMLVEQWGDLKARIKEGN